MYLLNTFNTLPTERENFGTRGSRGVLVSCYLKDVSLFVLRVSTSNLGQGEVGMFSLCLSGFSLGTLVSSHRLKTCMWVLDNWSFKISPKGEWLSMSMSVFLPYDSWLHPPLMSLDWIRGRKYVDGLVQLPACWRCFRKWHWSDFI